MLDILPVHSTWNLMSNMTSLCSVAVLSSSAFCSCCLGQSLLGPMWPNGLQKNTMQHHGTQWNTCYYYFFNQSITVIHILYILSIFLFDQKGQGFWFHVAYIVCVCACPPAVFVCSEAFDWRHRGGWATMQSPHCCQPVCAPEVVGQSHGQYTQHACSIVKPYMDQLCPMVALEEWFIAFRCI